MLINAMRQTELTVRLWFHGAITNLVIFFFRSSTSKTCLLPHEHPHSTSLHLSMSSKAFAQGSFSMAVYCIQFQHGESVCNLFGRIGGDAELSERGLKVSY